MTNLKHPDVTLAQLLAAATWVGTQLVAMGYVDNNTNSYVLSLAGTVITAAWTIGDAIIRNGRAHAAAALHNTVE